MNTALSVVQFCNTKRHTTVQKLMEVARIVAEKKQVSIAAKKIRQERGTKEGASYHQYYHILAKHSANLKKE